jgi:AcrR family transcriptional regulator
MPSSPKIGKEIILKAALDVLIRDGYSALTIKTLAKETKSSTQPISWHFGNMEGLRKALTDYALYYAHQKMRPSSDNGMDAFKEMGISLINIAFDEPNLFRYLYFDESGSFHMDGFDSLVNNESNSALIKGMAEYLHISREQVSKYMQNMLIYTHGIASFIASGLIASEKEHVLKMVNDTADAFLTQTGAKVKKERTFKLLRKFKSIFD